MRRAEKCPIWLLLAVFAPAFLYSQTPSGPGNWTMLFGSLRFHDKWSWHFEAQYRDYELIDQPEQLLFRSGFNYHVSGQSMLTAGYAYVPSYPFDEEKFNPSVKENRLWQQLFTRHQHGRFYFEHRFRLEQRFISRRSVSNYADRFRYMLRINIPLSQKTLADKTVFVSFYNELFLIPPDYRVDRNRLYGALAYKFGPALSIQVGYLAQTVNSKTLSYLQTALFYNPDVRDKK